MTNVLLVELNTTEEQTARLRELQEVFVQACNSLGPMVRETRCWNRVGLHHLAYRRLREQFPGMGSQMACNVIYSVSRACRTVYQHPASPFNLSRLGGKALPHVRFGPDSPVYFDRHTLSLRGSAISMFTLDGRMRFDITLEPSAEERFRTDKIREIALARRADGIYVLSFNFATDTAAENTLSIQQAQPLPPNLQVESAA